MINDPLIPVSSFCNFCGHQLTLEEDNRTGIITYACESCGRGGTSAGAPEQKNIAQTYSVKWGKKKERVL